TGPKGALWEAIILKNYGCTHFMVAEDQNDPFERCHRNRRSVHSAFQSGNHHQHQRVHPRGSGSGSVALP
ncbi:MAG: hypothetical protein GY765_36860, partial [bacterium]|nr:hypothetical protein [bacterium]